MPHWGAPPQPVIHLAVDLVPVYGVYYSFAQSRYIKRVLLDVEWHPCIGITDSEVRQHYAWLPLILATSGVSITTTSAAPLKIFSSLVVSLGIKYITTLESFGVGKTPPPEPPQ
ncbi:MAG: hypothetical protein QW453_01665 [Thermoprotei archaeon]